MPTGPRETSYALAGPAPAKPPDPARIFHIPPEVKYLQAEQLTALGEAFRTWSQTAGGPARRQARQRVWLVYLLLRYSAGRLGEVLALDDRQDLDLAGGSVLLGSRRVPIPDDVAAELQAFLEDSASQALRGQVLRLDQGYMRRQFRARAAQCGLPSELANPRVLRNSRAIELLRQGVPLTIVQEVLGQSTVNLTANLLSFSQEDSRRIVDYHLTKETRLRTSARNSFRGRVTRVRKGALQSEVEMVTSGGFAIVSVITNDSLGNLGIRRDVPLTALVKAPWVIVARIQGLPPVSARNRLSGVLRQIKTDTISCELIVELADATMVCALVTKGSVRELGLKVGDQVWTLFKSSAVILTAD